jgi:hypothetical protein
MLYSKTLDGRVTLRNPTQKLIDYLAIGNIYFENKDIFGLGDADFKEDLSNLRDGSGDNLALKKTSAEALNNAMNSTDDKGAAAVAGAGGSTPAASTVATSSAVPAKPAAVSTAPASQSAAQSQVKVQPAVSQPTVSVQVAPKATPAATAAPVATAPAPAAAPATNNTVIETL